MYSQLFNLQQELIVLQITKTYQMVNNIYRKLFQQFIYGQIYYLSHKLRVMCFTCQIVCRITY